MITRHLSVCRLCFAVAAWTCTPAIAVGIDCGRALGQVETAICASATLQKADSQLASAYAAALVRDPARANALRRDQREWLGERNRATVAQLPHLYRARIEFLTNIGTPAATRGLPVARKLLVDLPGLPIASLETVVQALARTGTVTLPKERSFDSVPSVIAALPAPPDASLRAALEQFSGGPSDFTLFYFPAVGLGGVLNIEGTAACEYWVGFRREASHTVTVSLPLGGCTRDDGYSGYLALVHGHAIAIGETDGIYEPDASLTWQRWLGHGWGSAERLHIRFDWALTNNRAQAGCAAPATHSLACTAETVARRALTSYLRNPALIVHPAWITPAEQKTFLSIKPLAQSELAARHSYGISVVWFPVRFGSEVIVGNIAKANIGSHPETGFVISFWARSRQPFVPLPDVWIGTEDRRVLLAARVP